MELKINLDETSDLVTNNNDLIVDYKRRLEECWERVGESINPPLIHANKNVMECKIQWKTI